MKLDTFEAKVIGSFVRVKSEHPNDYDLLRNSDHQLVQVTGVKRCSSMSSSEILLRVSDMVKEVPISKLSDDDFTKEECEDLCCRVKFRWLERPTVAEFGRMARSLHEDITKDWLARESASLRKRIDQANENGRKREVSEYIDSLLLLQTPAEQSRLLNEVPQVLADTNEDPIRKGDEDTSEAQEASLESTADLFNDDCSKSSEASGHEGEEAYWSIDAVRSTMTPTSLETLKRSYGIPNNIVLRLPEKGQLASSPPQGAVTLHSTFFEFGIRLPFHPFLRYMLSHLQCAPAQLSPNAWRALIGTYIIWKQCQFPEITFREFQWLYQLKIHPISRGWYCLSTWPGKEAMVINSPSSNKNWKEKWFFASGHWEADPNEQDLEHRIPTAFRTPAIWKKPSELTTEQKNNIKTAFAIPSEDRSCKVLLTPKNLKRYWFTAPPSTSTMPSSSQGRMKRNHSEKIPVEPIKVSTKKMKVRSSSQAGSPPVSENSPPRHASKMTRKSFENDKKILSDQINQEVEKNSKLQGQLDEEKAMSARLREHIADLKATVTDATSRADEAVARADAAKRDNRELRKVNKELKDSITGWEEAAIKQLSSKQK